MLCWRPTEERLVGETIHQYEILEPLGEGGMGTVYKARDTKLNRLVAIKSLRATSPDRKARFLQEAQASSALNHPNIITVHDLLTHGGQDYIVMELVTGKTLDRLIPKTGLRLDDALKIAIPAAAALTAAHEAGIVHRDVKPSNIMVRDDGVVKVLDFGLAKLTDSGGASEDDTTRTMRPETEDGTILGTVSYMSPEQAEGRRVDARSDVFCFGAVLYEMVTGRRAFQTGSKLSTLSAILKEDPTPLHEIDATAPRELERIVARCLKKDPERRYQLMKEVRLALEELKEESDSGRLSSSSSAAGMAPPPPPASRSKLPWILTALAATAAIAAGGWAWTRSRVLEKAPELRLRQLTQDFGWSGNPALSSDGKMVAYSSDRAGDGGYDIYVQPVAGGSAPIRLTRHPANEFRPQFSPDGALVSYWSAREGGGIYVMPSLGGEERLVLRGRCGQSQGMFSPDGKSIAATCGSDYTTAAYVVPVGGGEARQVGQEFYRAVVMGWSPDGSQLLMVGGREQGRGKHDWWLLDLASGRWTALKARRLFPKLSTAESPPVVQTWNQDGLFLSWGGNLVRIPFQGTAESLGPIERLTTGAGRESWPSVVRMPAGGWRIAFTSNGAGESILHRLDLQRPGAKPEPIVENGGDRTTPSLSRDGARLVYVKHDIEGHALVTRDVATGAERTLLRQKADIRARLSPDGTVIAYNPTSTNEGEGELLLVPWAGGAAKNVCSDCGLIYDWAPDARRVIYRTGNPVRFWTVDVQTGAKVEILAHPKHVFHAARFSPDMKWLTFHLAPGDGPQHVFITPVREGKGAPEAEWISVFDKPGRHSRPWFAADGNAIMFTSDASGPPALFSQRLDAVTKRPAGDPVVLFGTDGLSGSLTGHSFGPGECARFIVLPLMRAHANVWMAE